MLRFSAAALAAIVGIAITGVFQGTPSSLAHERRTVLENYEFVVGWLNEPAIAYEPNGLDLRVTLFPNGVPEEGAEGAEEEGQPMEGLEEMLQAEIIAGGGAQTRKLTLEPAFGEEGAYESPLIPTVPGDYTFRIFGELDGQPVDESFRSGPETFGVIEDPAEIQFPQTLEPLSPSGNTSDSGSNNSSDDTARTLGIIGIIVGVIGLAVGGLAVATRRS
jgi:hypothetical protein